MDTQTKLTPLKLTPSSTRCLSKIGCKHQMTMSTDMASSSFEAGNSLSCTCTSSVPLQTSVGLVRINSWLCCWLKCTKGDSGDKQSSSCFTICFLPPSVAASSGAGESIEELECRLRPESALSSVLQSSSSLE